jgi:hypothetical protein
MRTWYAISVLFLSLPVCLGNIKQYNTNYEILVFLYGHPKRAMLIRKICYAFTYFHTPCLLFQIFLVTLKIKGIGKWTYFITLVHLALQFSKQQPRCNSHKHTSTKLNSEALAYERSMLTERLPLVGEVVPTFADRRCRVVSATDSHGR